MKKIILVILLLCSFPLLAKADMGAPAMTEYEVRVKNVNGTVLESYDDKEDITVAYDTILTIQYEYNVDGIYYGDTTYNKQNYMVKLDDTEVIKKDVDLTKFSKDKTTVYVFDDYAYLYAGPSKMYGKVEGDVKVPVGTTLTYEYHDEVWAYVSYNGIKGWIYIYEFSEFDPYNGEIKCSVANINSGKLFTIEKVNLYADPRGEQKIDITIPHDVEVTYDYTFYPGSYAASYYVNYEGKSGWLVIEDEKDIAYVEKGDIYIVDSTEIHALNNFQSKTIVTIPKNTEVTYTKINYINENAWYYVKYEDKEGWIAKEYDENMETKNEFIVSARAKYKVKDENIIYSDLNWTSTGKNVPKDVEVTVKYTYYDYGKWYYIEDEEYQGWVKTNMTFLEYIEEDEEEIPIDPIIPDPAPEEELKDHKTPLSIKDYALYCTLGAVVLALVIFVIIKLVNKKRKVKVI